MLDEQNLIQEFLDDREKFTGDEQTIIAFAHLCETQPELFGDLQNSLTELEEKLPDNLEAIAEALYNWCQDNAPNVYRQLLKLVEDESKAPGGQKNLKSEQAKKLIKQGIRKPKPKNDKQK